MNPYSCWRSSPSGYSGTSSRSYPGTRNRLSMTYDSKHASPSSSADNTIDFFDTDQSRKPYSFAICVLLRVLASVAFIDISAWTRHRQDPVQPPSLLSGSKFFWEVINPAFIQDRWPHGNRMGGIRLTVSKPSVFNFLLICRLTGSAPA